MLSAISSIRPRVFMRRAELGRSPAIHPGQARGQGAPAKFPETGDANDDPADRPIVAGIQKSDLSTQPGETKNTGRNRTELMFSTRTASFSRKLLVRGMIAPARKAPKSAWIPMVSVLKADASTTAITIASVFLSGSGCSNAGCPINSHDRWPHDCKHETNEDEHDAKLNTAALRLAARAIATTNARMVHAVTSSTAAQAVAVAPNDV